MKPFDRGYQYDPMNVQRTIEYYFKVETGEDKSMVDKKETIFVSSKLDNDLADKIVNENIPEFPTSMRLDKVYPTSLKLVQIKTGMRLDYFADEFEN